MGTGPYYMRRVVGKGRTEELVSRCLTLPEPAAEILEWRKSVIVTQAEVICGGVIVTGSVRSRCLYLTPDRAPPPGAGGPEVSGRVLHHTAEIPFTIHIKVRRAAPGMDVRVTAAHVLDDASRTWHSGGWITGTVDRSLVLAAVRVMSPELLPAVHKPAPALRKRKPPPERRPTPAPRKQARVKAAPPPPPEPRGSEMWLHPSANIPVTQREPRCD